MTETTTPKPPQSSLIAEALSEAAALHGAGRLKEAEEVYRAILELQPDHTDANFNMGLMARQLRQPAAALPFFKAALAASPDQEPFWVAYVETLIETGQHDAADEVLALGMRHGLRTEVVANLSRTPAPKPMAATTQSGKAATTQGADEITAITSLIQDKRFTEAEKRARRLTERFPRQGNGWALLGAAILEQGRGADALIPMKKAVGLLPSDARTHSNLGNVWREIGRLDEAIASYRRALKIDSNLAEAHNNLGLTLWDAGQIDDAFASYRRALDLRPDYVTALSNLAAGLLQIGRHEEAEVCLRQALKLDPRSGASMNNLALALRAQGKTSEAMNAAARSIGIKETTDAKEIFVECVKHAQLKWVGSDLRAMLVRALSEPWGRPVDLTRTCTSLVKTAPGIAESVGRSISAWPRRLAASDLFGPAGLAAIVTDPLLRALLVSAPIFDVEMERFLTMTRYALLDSVIDTADVDDPDNAIAEYCGALAQQCFINEYVYAFTDDEAQRAEKLRDALVATLGAGAPVPALWVTVVAAYFPLHCLPLADRLLGCKWPTAVAAVLTQQISEPRDELALRSTLPRLSAIEDETSQQVQSQYEQNPYPRWIETAPAGNACTVDQYLRRAFPLARLRPLGKGANVDILIAGCGTGQQSIETALRHPGARILAVDLSLTSLCYAKRKTQAVGLSSIEYAQADILKLETLDRSFDVITCTGVLHHLADPLAGWRALLSRLRPGGLMSLGFYSETARRNVVRTRAFIAERGYDATVEDIRHCRQDIIELDAEEGLGTTIKSSDFFSISGCRDLLFHVQEHRMTLAAIADFLRDNGLKFIGFRLGARTIQAYRRRFPTDPAGVDLAQWQAFESENPDTFWGMYQFWVQKVA